jgi:hypothetical protein
MAQQQQQQQQPIPPQPPLPDFPSLQAHIQGAAQELGKFQNLPGVNVANELVQIRNLLAAIQGTLNQHTATLDRLERK